MRGLPARFRLWVLGFATMRTHPQRPLRALSALSVALLLAAAPAAAQRPLDSELVVSGLNAPVQTLAAPGDDASRLFVITQFGRIRIIEDDVLLPTIFLDVNSKLIFSGERGLLGMAFHPDYENNGHFYINYTDNTGGDTVIERYTRDPLDPDLADPNSALKLLEVDQPFSNHNCGWMEFGPDGYLYIGMGDGGSGGDPLNSGQRGDTLLGKILRIDVDNPAPGLNYGIPPTNPFVNDPNFRDEIWAYGLRNPWRNAFDPATGDLWIADVGQSDWEEVNFEPADSGGGRNYGWRIMEGAHCHNPSSGCNQTGLVKPVHEYHHRVGQFFVHCSITGGRIYRGRSMATMHGRYFLADYCSKSVWSFRYQDPLLFDFEDHSADLAPPVGSLDRIRSFGVDADGELYICAGGDVWRVVPDDLRLQVPQLEVGVATTLQISGGAASAPVALAFSLTGLGSTPIPGAGITLDLSSPRLAGTTTTDAQGAASFPGTPPPALANATIWFQAAQQGQVSNVVVEQVD